MNILISKIKEQDFLEEFVVPEDESFDACFQIMAFTTSNNISSQDIEDERLDQMAMELENYGYGSFFCIEDFQHQLRDVSDNGHAWYKIVDKDGETQNVLHGHETQLFKICKFGKENYADFFLVTDNDADRFNSDKANCLASDYLDSMVKGIR